MIACQRFLIVICLLLTVSVCRAQQAVPLWDRFELILTDHPKGNGFTDVRLSAVFTNGDTSFSVNGFYDGENRFIIRFMPMKKGSWHFKTTSNHSALHNKQGQFTCVDPLPDNNGPVSVHQEFHFRYASGKSFYPVGTTAYAWNHMDTGIQAITQISLRKGAFNKVRMGVFPKNYDLVTEEPVLYPFEKNSGKDSQRIKWDYSRFNPLFFAALEKQILALTEMGIESDLILFHPYDKGRWGFDEMPLEANLRYIRYLMARLSSFHAVWWSMANEWDYVKSKTISDWKMLTKEVKSNDPYRHLLSIHGSTAMYFDYALPEFTHVSVQDEAPVMNFGGASILRNVYKKPVVYDEVGYEGNLKQRWGRYSGEEMTRLMWMGVIGGTYVTHGETYQYSGKTDTIFWAKGGYFRGSSWERARFMRQVLEQLNGPLEPADISRDLQTATTGKGTYLIYFGNEAKDNWTLSIPAKNYSFERPATGMRFKADIIDTWNMTITPWPETIQLGELTDYRFYDKGKMKISLPGKPFILIRLTRI